LKFNVKQATSNFFQRQWPLLPKDNNNNNIFLYLHKLTERRMIQTVWTDDRGHYKS